MSGRRPFSSVLALPPKLFADLLAFTRRQILPALLQPLTLFDRQVTKAPEVVADPALLRTWQLLELPVALAQLAALRIR